MFLGQKTQKQVVPVTDEERSFFSIPRRESVYCEDGDTISVRRGAGVCGSYATILRPARTSVSTSIRFRSRSLIEIQPIL